MSPTLFPTQEVTVTQVPLPHALSTHGMGVGVEVVVGVVVAVGAGGPCSS